MATGLISGSANASTPDYIGPAIKQLTITNSAKSLNGNVGTYFSAHFKVSGGTPVYKWTTSGLPAGLSLSVSPSAMTDCAQPADPPAGWRCPDPYSSGEDIVISGIPTQSGTFNTSLTVTDSNGATTTGQYTFTISGTGIAPNPMYVSGYVDTVASDKVEGWAFDQNAQPTWVALKYEQVGNPSVSFYHEIAPSINRPDAASWLQANLNPALSISQPLGFKDNPASFITTPGTYKLTRVVTSQSGYVLEMSQQAKNATFTISGQTNSDLNITGSQYATGAVGKPFSGSFAVTGGISPYSWSVISGSLPPGLNTSFGAYNCLVAPCVNPKDYWYLSGTPTQNGTYTYTIRATDAAGKSGMVAFTTMITGGGASVDTVFSPKSGDVWSVGNQYTIGWSLVLGQRVNITLHKAECKNSTCIAIAPYQIATNVSNNGSFNWTPDNIGAAYQGLVYLVVQNVDGSTRVSSNDFTLNPKPVTLVPPSGAIVITNPAAGTTWKMGQTYEIKWQPYPQNSSRLPATITLDPYIACLHSNPACALAQPMGITIGTADLSAGSFKWTVPTESGKIFWGTVQISMAVENTDITGTSGVFSVVEPGSNDGKPQLTPGQIVVGTANGTVYVITNDGYKYGFISYQDFVSRGYRFTQVQKVDQALLDSIPVTTVFRRSGGVTYKYANSAQVYYLTQAGCQQKYTSLAVLAAWKVAIRDIVTIGTNETYPDCSFMFVRLPSGAIAKVGGALFLVEGETLRPFSSWQAYLQAGFGPVNVRSAVTLSEGERQLLYPTLGQPI